MEKILAFHLNDTDFYKLKQAAAVLKIKAAAIDPADCMQPLKYLVNGEAAQPKEPFTGTVPAESLLLLCGFDDKRLDKLLLALRKQKIYTDYKAILTPTNQNWNLLRLMLEMKAEKDAIEGGKK